MRVAWPMVHRMSGREGSVFRLAAVGLLVFVVSGCGDGLDQVRENAGHLPIPAERPADVTEPYEVVTVTGPHSLVLAGAEGRDEVILVGVGDVDLVEPEKERRRPGVRREEGPNEALLAIEACADQVAMDELVSLVGEGQVYAEYVDDGTQSEGATVKDEGDEEGNADAGDEAEAEEGVEPPDPRPAVYLWAGDVLVNVGMLESGTQGVRAGVPVPFSMQTEFRKVEKEAKEVQAGLYAPGSCGQPIEEDDDEDD